MPFKLDAFNKSKKVLKDIYEKNPHLCFYQESEPIQYFKDIVPLLHQELNTYELTVLVENLALELTGTYNEAFYKLKKVYDAIVLFKTDPLFVLGEYLDEIKGFEGLAGQCPRDTED